VASWINKVYWTIHHVTKPIPALWICGIRNNIIRLEEAVNIRRTPLSTASKKVVKVQNERGQRPSPNLPKTMRQQREAL